MSDNDYYELSRRLERVDYFEYCVKGSSYKPPIPFPSPSAEAQNILNAHACTEEIFSFQNYDVDEDRYSLWRKFYGIYTAMLPENQFLIVQRVLCKEDCIEKLMRSQENILVRFFISETLTIRNVFRLIMSFDAGSDANKVFRNLFLSMRLLSPKDQKDFYGNLNSMHMLGKEKMEGSGLALPELGSFIPALFDFEAFPMSYHKAAGIQTSEHLSIFSETLFDSFPLIVKSSELHENVSVCRSHLEKIWLAVKQPKYEAENWNSIVLRLIKSHEWIPDDMRERFLALADIEPISDLSLFLRLIIAEGYAVSKQSIDLEILLEAFQVHSEEGQKTQILLSQMLRVAPDVFWNHYSWKIARKIQATTAIKEVNVLRVAYSRILVLYTDCVPEYYADLLRGLDEDGKLWIKVLIRCIKPFPIHITYETFYKALRNKLEVLFSDLETDEEYINSVSLAFTRILGIQNRVILDDWRILMNFPSNWINKDIICDLLLETPELTLSEEMIKQLTHRYLFENFKKDHARYSSILTRLAETTKCPVKLALDTLQAIENKQDFDYKNHSRFIGVWSFFDVLAERCPSAEVHERLVAHLIKTLTRGGIVYNSNDSSAVAMMHLIFHIVELNLSHTDQHQQNLLFLQQRFMNDILSPNGSYYNSFHFALFLANTGHDIINALNPPIYLSDLDFFKAAQLLYLHRIKSDAFQVENLLTAVQRITRYSCFIISCPDKIFVSNAILSSYVIQLIEEFQSEPYYPQIYSLLFDLASRKNFINPGFAPRLFLTEAKRTAPEIDELVKERLLDVDTWYIRDLKDDDRIDYFLCYRREYQEVLRGIILLFQNTKLDTKSVKFAASLYFLKGISFHEISDPFSTSILTQLG
jgi:hypothetical protein